MSSSRINIPLPTGECCQRSSETSLLPQGEGPRVRADASDIAIRVQGLSKCYQIYETPGDRLKQFVVPRLQRLAGQTPRQYFREFWALKDVSFEIKKGESVGIIGRNGSGKSTLLQIICGTLSPTSGHVETNGRIAALLELGSGFNPEFTGRENVYMNGAVLGLSKEEIDARFDNIVAFADIGEFMGQPVKTYSSGMYVRLAFAVIANVEADILVIDEALAVGDAFFTQKCMRFLRKFREQGMLLFVSHDSAAVVNLCRRAIWLDKGMTRMQSSAKEVCETYLAAFYEEQQGPSALSDAPETTKHARAVETANIKDQRLEFIDSSKYRNDIEIFRFNPDSTAFGKGGLRIEDVKLLSEQGEPLSWVVGGERVTLAVRMRALQDSRGPIVGFLFKDRLGQTLFADNTYLTYAQNPVSLRAGEEAQALFSFQMPILPAGNYTITAAAAEGTQADHVQHHWLHDALIVRSHSSSVCTGLVGIPMLAIRLRRTHDG